MSKKYDSHEAKFKLRVAAESLKLTKTLRKLITIFACFLIVQANSNCMCDGQKMVVAVSVADLRSRPEHVQTGLQGPAFSKDIGAQDSQVLFGESIMGEDIPGESEWVKVITLTQKNWNGQAWVGYPGYILKTCLKVITEFPSYNIVLQNLWTPMYDAMDQSSPSRLLAMGTRLEAQKIAPKSDWWQVLIDKKVCGYLKDDTGIYKLSQTIHESEDSLREKIIRAAHVLLTPQTPYVWGGRSPLDKNSPSQITGMDCSGLSLSSYLAAGIEIPRDSGPQYRMSMPLAHGKEMKKADLIFLANENGTRISHVMVYVGDGYFIDSFGEGTSIAEALKKGLSKDMFGTRKIAVREFLGVNIDDIEAGKTVTKNGKKILLGTYFGKTKST